MRLWPLQGWDFLGGKKCSACSTLDTRYNAVSGQFSPPCPLAAFQSKLKLLLWKLKLGAHGRLWTWPIQTIFRESHKHLKHAGGSPSISVCVVCFDSVSLTQFSYPPTPASSVLRLQMRATMSDSSSML